MVRSSVTKSFSFSYAHLLPNHYGKCAGLHGHNARLDVTVVGDISSEEGVSNEGMVIDFGIVKDVVQTSILDIWDHKFLACGDEWVVAAANMYANSCPAPDDEKLLAEFNVYPQIATLGMRTTAENLACLSLSLLQQPVFDSARKNGGNYWVSQVTFFETPTSWATIQSRDISDYEIASLLEKYRGAR